MAHQPSSYTPPPQIKLGLMKNSTRTLDRNGPPFLFLCEKFPRISRKIKVGIFIDPHICWLMKDPKLDLALSDDEKSAWNALRHVAIGFQWNVEAITFRNPVEDFTTSWEKLGCNMSLQKHFIHSQLDSFPASFGAIQGQTWSHHQDISMMKKRY